jgi:hypothetical protein
MLKPTYADTPWHLGACAGRYPVGHDFDLSPRPPHETPPLECRSPQGSPLRSAFHSCKPSPLLYPHPHSALPHQRRLHQRRPHPRRFASSSLYRIRPSFPTPLRSRSSPPPPPSLLSTQNHSRHRRGASWLPPPLTQTPPRTFAAPSAPRRRRLALRRYQPPREDRTGTTSIKIWATSRTPHPAASVTGFAHARTTR